MKKISLVVAALATTALTTLTPAFADGDQKIVAEPLELTIHFHWRRSKGYIEDWPVEKAACAATNVCLIDETTGKNASNSNEAMNLLLAKGDLPDIVGGERIRQPINEFGPQGAFVPLNGLIDEHAPNIKAWFEEHPGLQQAISAWDGNMYYIPYLPDGKYARAWFIRQDWLDKLGLEQPNTIEELEQVLIAFRDQDPNGNGLKDEIPYFNRTWEETLRPINFWDARTSGSDTYHDFMVVDGKIQHPYAVDSFREGLKNLARWYEEGLIDPEIYTRGSSSRDYLLSENLGGFTHDWFASTSGYNVSLKDKVEGFNFIPFLPPKSVSGVRMQEHRRIPIKPDGWAISYNNEHPVETIKYFDFWFSVEGALLANFGIEGEHYTMVDGEPVYTEAILGSGRAVNSQMYEIGAQAFRGYPQDYRYEWQWTRESARKGIELYDTEDLLIDQFLGVAFKKEEQEVYDKYWPNLRTYMLERTQAWVLGNGDIEAEWDDYIAQLENRGLNEVLEVMQTAHDRQYGG